ncbi:MAG: putative transcriptional regulator, LysR family, partial [Friedmanniella sp.]|nr:putative transcriptional regulator, LysR family [Friedmanniella sp.]
MTSTPAAAEPADRAVPVLTVGFVPGVTLAKWRRIWADRFPRLGLDVIELPVSDQLAALTQERVDMCFVRLPAADPRLHVIPLYEEVPVVVVPKDHPVSLFDEVTLADLSEEDLLEDLEGVDSFDLVAGGAGVLLVPQSVARSHSRRDLVHRPVSDAPTTRVALAWLQENPHEMIEEFIGIVRGRTPNSSRSPRPAEPAKAPKP